VLGVGPGAINASPFELIARRRRIMGSPSGSRHDLRDTLAFAACHDVRPEVTTYPLEQANELVARMRDGKVSGRAVLTLA
jgi:D-arabinose 1-dehydrogenase-like Zn-dependent alcohol dehydrogenase